MLKARSLLLPIVVAVGGVLVWTGVGERSPGPTTILAADNGPKPPPDGGAVRARLGDNRATPRGRKPILQSRPTPLWQLREALPAPEMEVDPDAPVVDVAAEAALTAPVPGDLDPTIDVQITQEIIDKAEELGSVEAMYEFVRNECTFQAYYGSQKGSVETLRQGGGNDYDLASLLIALLRASDIPARYAVGMVEMPVDRANSWLSVEDGWAAGSILYTNGLEAVIVVSGPDVVAIRARRVWVEAYVPRGYGSPVWVPLDPSFSLSTIHEGTDIPEEMVLDAQDFVDEYWDPSDPGVTLPRPETITELLEQDIQAYLDVNYPGTSVDDVMRKHEIVPENLGILPGSLPYTVRSRDLAFSEIPADRRYQIRFHLHGATDLIDHTLNLPEIAGKRVTIDYVGATPADETIIEGYGGIYQTPPSLVDLKPVLRVEGVDVAVGATGVGMGLLHGSDIHFLAPVNGQGLPQNVVPAIYNVIVCGASQAVGLAIEGASEGLLNPPPEDDTEGTAQLLYDTAMDYLANCRNADLKLGQLMHAYVTTGVADAIVENVVNVTYDGGVPQTFDWVALRVDADRSVVGYWPVDRWVEPPPDPECKDFMIIGGAEGSLLESRIYEDSYGQDAVSTIKILALSVDAGITVYKRWGSLPLPTNTQPGYVQDALEYAISIGHVVTFPADPITVGTPETGEWTGTGWIDMEPSSGAAGYIISGNNNGGATVEIWPPEFIDLQEGDRSVVQVDIEITNPPNDSPDPPAVYTRDNEEHLEFEYLLHVTYDDASTATLGPYKRTTRNTTKTFSPGNYTFHVWIARFWWWWGTLAHAERDVSIVGVLIREDDGTDLGKDPPKFLPVKPPAPAATPSVDVKALVIPDQAPNGAALASAYAWSGGAGSKLSFTTPAQQTTKIEPAGPDPSTAVDDQEVNVVVNLPGGKTQHGYAKFTFAQGGTDEKHKMTVFRVQLKQVSFSGTKYHAIREDNGSVTYTAPHWQDNNSDGDAADAGERRYPLCFTRNTKMKIDEAKFTCDPAAVLTGTPKIKGDGPGSADIAETSATVSGNELSITNVEADNAFPNEINLINPMSISFELKLDGDTKSWGAGTSDNRVYTTLADPTAGPLYETLLDIGCRNAGGATAAAAAVASIWADFFGPMPGVTRKPMDGHNVADGMEMKYWNPPATASQTMAGMLAHATGNGTCVAWSYLLHETLKAQGITGSTIREITANPAVNPGANAFMVKNWAFDKHLRTGPDGLRNSALAGDDVALFDVGDGYPNTDCITAGTNLVTAPAGDDTVAGSNVTTGPNGVCNTTKDGNDTQTLPVGSGQPNRTAITAGPNGTLNTTPAGDDGTSGTTIHTGADGVCQTTATGDDVQVIPAGSGQPNTVCVTAGTNLITTPPVGDDVTVGDKITTGPNGKCETTKAGNDVQVIPVGQGEPDTPCVMPGTDGVLNSTTGGDDTEQDGLFPGRPYPYVRGYDAVNLDGIPGQGNSEPPEVFRNHFITVYGGEYYDPSYGAGSYTSQNNHENAAIDGVLSGQRAKKNDTATQELRYTP